MSSGSWDAGYRLIDLIADKIYEERVARHNLHTVGSVCSVCSAAVLQCCTLLHVPGTRELRRGRAASSFGYTWGGVGYANLW